MDSDRITKDFTFSEFEKSATAKNAGIDNSIPDDGTRWAIRLLTMTVLQPLRNAACRPLKINSGYRCPELNRLVGGVPDSQHVKGEAADIAAADPLYLAQLVLRNNLPFDQMILYSDFVHISHKKYGIQRRQILYSRSYKMTYPKNPML
ncbi:MAG: D-Ala-D-Ala carboxypeptidase family metallohydrolase [Bacteroidales bacterium]|jgi:hypothetical protein|nr:D-Ala-D-Ala carboxypeptidase family metallohydrolase [Bacteroidales bacterium]MCI2133049.1 D-Ala-D-Ala carboxypeptidase family metallohydrolase [Bacteroidales bacterium]